MNRQLVGKIVLLGGTGVGKTSIVTKAVSNTFDPNQVPTIGGSFASKAFELSNGETIMIRIWDTAGQERFRSLASMYYQDAHCAILVFSVDSKSTFEEINYWMDELKANYSELPILVLVGNKTDLSDSDRALAYSDGKALARAIGARYVETSAKSGEGIEELFSMAAAEIAEELQTVQVSEQAKIELVAAAGAGAKSDCC